MSALLLKGYLMSAIAHNSVPFANTQAADRGQTFRFIATDRIPHCGWPLDHHSAILAAEVDTVMNGI